MHRAVFPGRWAGLVCLLFSMSWVWLVACNVKRRTSRSANGLRHKEKTMTRNLMAVLVVTGVGMYGQQYPPQQYPQQGYPQQNYPQQGSAQQQYPQQQYPEQDPRYQGRMGSTTTASMPMIRGITDTTRTSRACMRRRRLLRPTTRISGRRCPGRGTHGLMDIGIIGADGMPGRPATG